jgi:peptidoglycan/LPS O-acetylase OafA/YrhL
MVTMTAEALPPGQERQASDPPAPLWQHIPVLDGVRGFAALIVMVWHYYQPLGPAAGGGRLGRLAYNLVAQGGTGVDLFFVLSGFLITGILLRARGSPRAWTRFYMRRVLRIFPLYYGALLGICVAALLMGRGLGGLTPTVWFWTYLQNVRGFFGVASAPEEQTAPWLTPAHFWSLAVEEHFYLFWPAIVLMISNRHLTKVLWGIVATSVLSRAVMIATTHVNLVAEFTLCRMDALALGALIAVYSGQEANVRRMGRMARWATPALLALALPVFLLTSGKGLDWVQSFKSSLTAAIYAGAVIILLTARGDDVVSRILSSAPMRNLGKYSYALYIFHPFVFIVFDAWLSQRPGLFRHAHNPLVALAPMAITYLAAFLSWHLYEKHFLKLKRFFDYDSRANAAHHGPAAAV